MGTNLNLSENASLAKKKIIFEKNKNNWLETKRFTDRHIHGLQIPALFLNQSWKKKKKNKK